MEFYVSEKVSALGIKVIFLTISNLEEIRFNDTLKTDIEKYYETITSNLTPEELSVEPSIIGYQNLHKAVDIHDKSLIASPESLFRLLFKYGTLRPINRIVDAYNFIAIKNKISIGAHDMEHISGNVELRLTKGNEVFIPLGKNKPQAINAGEYCYIDDENEIICRLDCRQCDKTKISDNTKSCLFIIQGNKCISTEQLGTTAKELLRIFSLKNSKVPQHSLTLV